MLFQSCISIRAFAIALVQLTLRSVREPVKYIPSSLKGLSSNEIFVCGVISGGLWAFPNRAYLVLLTFMASPEIL